MFHAASVYVLCKVLLEFFKLYYSILKIFRYINKKNNNNNNNNNNNVAAALSKVTTVTWLYFKQSAFSCKLEICYLSLPL